MTAADQLREILSTSDDLFTAGEKTAPCIFNCFDEDLTLPETGSRQLIARAFAVVCWDDFSDLEEDVQVTVNGDLYSVLDVQRIHDGHAAHVNLQRVRA